MISRHTLTMVQGVTFLLELNKKHFYIMGDFCIYGIDKGIKEYYNELKR